MGGRRIYKDKRWGGGRSCTASGSPERWWPLGSPHGCVAYPARPVGTRAAARACQGLGCAATVLLAGSPKPGNKIARASGPGGWGQRDSRGGLPWESRAFFQSNSFEIARAREDFASLFQRGCPPVVCSSCSPSQCPGASLGWLPANGQFAVEKSPRGFLLLPKTTSSYLSKVGSLLPTCPGHPVLPPGHTHPQ